MSNSLVINGLDEAIAGLGGFVNEMKETAFDSVDEVLTVIEREMLGKAATFNKYAEGVLVNSISHTTLLNEEGVFGSVGVYDMSNKTSSGHRRVEAPIIANFLEVGVQPHSLVSGTYAPKLDKPESIRKTYQREARKNAPGLWHPGFEANPFLRTSFFNNADKIGIVTTRNLDKLAGKL